MIDERTTHFRTECKNCFSYKNGVCVRGRIDLFKERNQVTIEDGFPVINTICNAFCSDELLAKKLDNIIRVQCDVIVHSIDVPVNDTTYILRTVQAAIDCPKDYRPNRIIVVVKSNLVRYQELYNALKTYCSAYYDGVPFKLIRITDDLDFAGVINKAVESVESMYYTLLSTKERPVPEYIQKLDTALNTKLKRFVLVDGDQKVYSTKAHTAFTGHSTDYTLADKLKDANAFQLENGVIKESMILTWDQL